MEDITKKIIADKVIKAIEEEGLYIYKAALFLKIIHSEYLYKVVKHKEKAKCPQITCWRKLQIWADSGLSIEEFGKPSQEKTPSPVDESYSARHIASAELAEAIKEEGVSYSEASRCLGFTRVEYTSKIINKGENSNCGPRIWDILDHWIETGLDLKNYRLQYVDAQGNNFAVPSAKMKKIQEALVDDDPESPIPFPTRHKLKQLEALYELIKEPMKTKWRDLCDVSGIGYKEFEIIREQSFITYTGKTRAIVWVWNTNPPTIEMAGNLLIKKFPPPSPLLKGPVNESEFTNLPKKETIKPIDMLHKMDKNFNWKAPTRTARRMEEVMRVYNKKNNHSVSINVKLMEGKVKIPTDPPIVKVAFLLFEFNGDPSESKYLVFAPNPDVSFYKFKRLGHSNSFMVSNTDLATDIIKAFGLNSKKCNYYDFTIKHANNISGMDFFEISIADEEADC